MSQESRLAHLKGRGFPGTGVCWFGLFLLLAPGLPNSGVEGLLLSSAPRNVVVLPGLGNASGDYSQLMEDLEGMGLRASAVPVQRYDWLRNAAGLRDPKYWQGKLAPRPTVDW